jgi:Response regulator containing a CheY-like receiver domain and an HTH DNA-binding domain
MKAEEILPEDLVRIIQTYVEGKNIYIPRKLGQRNEWGKGTGIKRELEERNLCIYKAFQNGICTKEIAEEFCLSQKTIQRIIRDMR